MNIFTDNTVSTQEKNFNEKDYLSMSYEELNNLTYEEYKKFEKDIYISLKNKVGETCSTEFSSLIEAKIEAANYTNQDNINKTIFSSLDETKLSASAFMNILNMEVSGYLLKLESNTSIRSKDTIDYESFFKERIEKYQAQEKSNNNNIHIENFSLLLKNLAQNYAHNQIITHHSLNSYSFAK